MRTIILFCCFLIFTSALPGLRVSVAEQYINSFLQQQLPTLIPKNMMISDIVKNTTHSNFLANITNISITSINVDYLNTKVSFNEEENKLALKITNLNVDLEFEYLFRALFLETSGSFSLMNNLTLNLEISSSYDSQIKKPNFSISSFSVEYHTFNVLFGGSILSSLLDIIEGYCDCVVKEQYPNLLQNVLDMGLQTIVSDLNNKYLIDLTFTEVGLDLGIEQGLENKASHLNVYLNALFYDPYTPFVNPPQPSNLPAFNESHKGIEIALNQGTLNSLLWTLNHQNIFDLFLKGDGLPIPMTFNTDLFQSSLPEFYNYYGSNKTIDLQFNTTNKSSPLIAFSANQSSIQLQINETITFLVRTAEGIHDEAFIVSYSFDIKLNCSLNESLLLVNVLDFTSDNAKLEKTKIPNLQIQGLTQMIDSTLPTAISLINYYLQTNPIAIPQIPAVKLQNLELLIQDENLVITVEPTLSELNTEIIKMVISQSERVIKKVKN